MAAHKHHIPLPHLHHPQAPLPVHNEIHGHLQRVPLPSSTTSNAPSSLLSSLTSHGTHHFHHQPSAALVGTTGFGSTNIGTFGTYGTLFGQAGTGSTSFASQNSFPLQTGVQAVSTALPSVAASHVGSLQSPSIVGPLTSTYGAQTSTSNGGFSVQTANLGAPAYGVQTTNLGVYGQAGLGITYPAAQAGVLEGTSSLSSLLATSTQDGLVSGGAVLVGGGGALQTSYPTVASSFGLGFDSTHLASHSSVVPTSQVSSAAFSLADLSIRPQIALGSIPTALPVYPNIEQTQIVIPQQEQAFFLQAPLVQTYVPQPVHIPTAVEVPIPVQQIVLREAPQVHFVEKIVPQVQVVPQFVDRIIPQVVYRDRIIEMEIRCCRACGEAIREQEVEVEGYRYHNRCLTACSGCGRPILGDLEIVDGKRWHRGCLTVCAGCQQRIIGEFLNAEGQTWHPKCYIACAGCGRRVLEDRFEWEGKWWHRGCCSLCAGCGGRITQDMFEAEGKTWHRGCYVLCSGCNRRILDGLFEAEGRAWHRGCYILCAGCNRRIVEGVFEAEGRTWHRGCYIICSGCGRRIAQGDGVEMEGRSWHRGCLLLCASCKRTIQQGFEFKALGKIWHAECFTCAVCKKGCSTEWVEYQGHAAHSQCANPPAAAASGGGGGAGMAVRQTIKAATYEEAVRLDKMDGKEDGKFNNTAILCEDPRWVERWGGLAAWEVSDERMAAHLQQEGHANAGSRVVVSQDGQLDGRV